MLVSVIVITYHRNQHLQSTIESIYRQEDLPGAFEVIVIDNGDDAVVPPSPRSDIVVRLIRPGRNLGVAGGRNLGAEQAQGAILVFIDDDAVWHDTRDIARFLTRFDVEPLCACVAVKVIIPATGAVDTRLLPAPRKAALLEATAPQATPYYYGCAYAMRAEAIAKVGAYPERFMYGMEEYDLSLRLIAAGYTIIYDPAIAVLHYEARTGRDFTGARYWTQQALNKSRVAWRLLPMPYPLTVPLIWSAAALVKTRQLRVALAIWRDLWQDRAQLRAERQVIPSSAIRYLKRVGARLLY